MSQVKFCSSSVPFPDSRQLDSMKKTLAELSIDYLHGELTKSAFAARARALMKNNGSYNLSLLLKRVEVTCGQHICEFWNECSDECQYISGSVEWEDDVSMFNKLDLPKSHFQRRPSSAIDVAQIKNNTGRLDELEKQLAFAQNAIAALYGQLQQEKKERSELNDQVEMLKKRVAEMDLIYERKTMVQVPALAAQLTPFKNIPIVDLSQPLESIALQIGRVCRQVGFMYIVNHGVDQKVMDSAFQMSKKFFDLPQDKKTALSVTRSKSGIRGYFSLGEEDLNGKDGTRDLKDDGGAIDATKYKGDFKEGFDCGRDLAPDDPDLDCHLVDRNIWPEEDVLPGFRGQVMEYQNSVRSVADKLMLAFAIALDLPQDFFTERTTKPMLTMRMLHYPPQPPKQDEHDQIGCGAHTDYGCCTILNQDDVGGLQVRNSENEWIEAPPVPGSFVINIGDMMSRWTNGVFSSTVHRVVNTSGRERYSIPMFINPNVGAVIECVDTCRSESEVPKYPTATSDEILLARYQEAFTHIKK